jgi:flagellar protein FlgJ
MAEFDTQSGINIGMVQDVQNLDKLRQMSLSKEGKQGALMAAPASSNPSSPRPCSRMRQANSVLTEGNPMNSSYTQFYEGMLDEQRVADMSSRGAGHCRDGGQAALTRADLHPSGWPGTQAAPAYRAGLQALSTPSASNDLIAASKVGKDFADNEMVS